MFNHNRPLRPLLLTSLAIAGMAVSGLQAAEKPRSQQVLECMHANLPTSVVADRMQLTHTDALGTQRQFELQVYAQRDEGRFDVSTIIKAPARLADGAYLMRATSENHLVYMYVPSLTQVRRLTGDSVRQSKLLGTDISWEDLQMMYTALLEGTLSVKGEAEYKGRKVDQLILIPSPKSESAYSRIYLDVDKQTCLPLEVRLTGEGDELLKKLSVDIGTLKQVNNQYWYASKIKLEDLSEGTLTHVEAVRHLEADVKISSQAFNPKRFYEVR
ncbi:MAG: outer membrane lipoprotein-sorting protein [Salinisphaeraceae bacterium]|nr:outer membrane lipoprotein-sorting protein [Salinisphaeraceae bacterium]